MILIWIPSHCGLEGNEKVDMEAKEATISGSTSSFRILRDVLNFWKEKQFNKFF